jgi:signal transduction histidine kinase/ligand-binding sensor domain-containing protein/DNA-binding response OmpR family regulator
MKKQLVTYLLIIFTLKISLAQIGSLDFRDITMEDGLPSNNVTCIAQDSQGFMWFGTEGGLVRYDGYKFKIYKYDPDDPESISDHHINSLFKDSKGTLWIGTTYVGLNRFDSKRDKFKSYKFDRNDSTSISQNHFVHAIYEDRKGRLWIGTAHGLNQYDYEHDNFIRYTNTIVDSSGIRPEWINFIFEDNKDNFWLGTGGGGLILYDRETRQSTRFKHDPQNYNSISNDYVSSIFEDDDGALWVGTEDGYDRFTLSNDKIIFEHDRKDIPPTISSKRVFDLYKRRGNAELIHANQTADFIDNQGNIWIATTHGGVKFYNSRQDVFQTYKYQLGESDGLKNSSVSAFHEQNDGNIWIGVNRGGLHYYNRRKNSLTYIPLDPNQPDNPFNEKVMTIEEDNYGDLWIGTEGKGIYKINLKSNKSVHYLPDINNPSSLHFPDITVIFEDSDKNIWIGTGGKGLSLYDRKNDAFIKFSGIDKHYIRNIYEDSQKILWICASPGLIRLDLNSMKFTTYWHEPNEEHTLTYTSAFEDSRNNLWAGSPYGLNLYDREKDKFTAYLVKDGLPDNYIAGILEDDNGNLWLSTRRGISRFNLIKKTFTNYDVNDGLQGPVFNNRAYAKLKTGELIFGGTEGFTLFHPDSVKDMVRIPPVVISDFHIFNKTVKPEDDNSPLQNEICHTKKIILKYFQHSISFEFAVLDYISPKNNKYKYILEGFNKDWIETDADHRVAAFTNLDPGKYVFRVIGSNNKGVWNKKGVSVQIIVTPPWWRTTLAYIVYIIFTGVIVWLTWNAQLRRVRIRNELKMSQFEKDKLQELDQMKSRFFANISHEIRTPLTLILGPLDQLISEASKEKWKNQLQIMSRNGRQLLHMINQLLDFSKAESGRMLLKAKKVNIVPLLKGMVHSFDSLAKRKKITLIFKSKENVIPVYIDTDKLEKIMANLLSNAFKFTSEGGKISVDLLIIPNNINEDQTVITKDRIVEIRITDTGIGIAPEHLDHIFDRYYQAEDNKNQTGTGIGLALTKELVELHHGHIFVQSEAGKGSTFIVQFLSGKTHLSNDEIIEDETADIPEEVIILEEVKSASEGSDDSFIKTTDEGKLNTNTDRSIILIVEDTEDVRNYIKGFLESKYQINEAQDGDDGFEKAIEIMPDLIVSDVMMPRMDGFQLCEKLKTDERTSHIPVILLTARASEGSKLEGLETGADDYIIKPFNSKELEIRIKNLIDQRQKLRERFSKDITLAPKDISVTSADERFLNRAIEIVEKHMGEPEFGVDIFAKEVALSHSQLYRKIHALTNQSPVEFIRILRLKRATGLLKQEYGNVAEIAYEVGFTNPSYFAECFKKLFGKSPSEYVKTEIGNRNLDIGK